LRLLLWQEVLLCLAKFGVAAISLGCAPICISDFIQSTVQI
jgi:hypothetical protein